MVIRIGTSGWSYAHWHPELCPPGLPATGRPSRYAAAFPTAELNSSFYRWPGPAAFRGWRDRLPEGFRLSVKAPRGLTHARKLYTPETWLQRIQAGWHELGGKRVALLVQLPSSLQRNDTRLACFLGLVPGWIRVAVEFRHPSWHCEAIFALVRVDGVTARHRRAGHSRGGAAGTSPAPMQERDVRLASRTPARPGLLCRGDHEILAGPMTTCRCVPAAGHDLLIPAGRLAGLRLAAAIGTEKMLSGRSG